MTGNHDIFSMVGEKVFPLLTWLGKDGHIVWILVGGFWAFFLLFAVVATLLGKKFPGLLGQRDEGEPLSSTGGYTPPRSPNWSVDTHGRPTPHRDGRSITGGY